jgi:hypothetical protein
MKARLNNSTNPGYIKAKDLPIGSIGKVDGKDTLLVVHTEENGAKWLIIWPSTPGGQVGIEAVDQLGPARECWDVVPLPKGTELILTF